MLAGAPLAAQTLTGEGSWGLCLGLLCRALCRYLLTRLLGNLQKSPCSA